MGMDEEKEKRTAELERVAAQRRRWLLSLTEAQALQLPPPDRYDWVLYVSAEEGTLAVERFKGPVGVAPVTHYHSGTQAQKTSPTGLKTIISGIRTTKEWYNGNE